MCGICGIISITHRNQLQEFLWDMVRLLSHRGPDGEGFFLEGPFALGHRRLAIVDLTEAGHQPMQSSCGNFVITYNGEIYNYLPLKKELESLGFSFFSHTDTEVVLNAYIAWKEDMVLKLNGMFAFSIFNKKEKTFFIARDRYGIKPLYYYHQGGDFLFSSEVKSIRACPLYDSKFNIEILIQYFTFQNIFTDSTFFKNIQLLSPGSYLIVTLKDTVHVKLKSYWDFEFFHEEPQLLSYEESLEALDHLFNQAVRRQLMGDVPIASYLSGGVDSGSITAIASQYHPNMKTFTIGFDLHSASGMELYFDEREKAEYISYLLGTEHYEMVLKAGDMEKALMPLVYHLENPRVGQSYPNYYAAKLASKFNKVVLSGAGGDELFAGYPWRYYRAVINSHFEDYIDKYYYFWQRLLTGEELQKVLAPSWSEIHHISPKEIFKSTFLSHAISLNKPEDYINHSLYFEAKTFLHGLLCMEDKISMAHGLETRLPFLDNDLVDFAMKLPIHFKLGNLSEVIRLNENEPGPKTSKYYEKTNDGKLILRKAMERYVPKKVTLLAKQGFSAPDASWFKGESMDYVKRLLFNKKAKVYEYLDFSTVTQMLNEHMNGTVNRRLLIWSLISFENWCQLFL